MLGFMAQLSHRSLLAAIAAFASEARIYWIGAVTSSFVAAVLVVSSAYIVLTVNSQTTPAPGLFVAAGILIWAILAIPIACFIAWRKKADMLQDAEALLFDKERVVAEQNNARGLLQNELDRERSRNTPNLHAAILQVATATATGERVEGGPRETLGTIFIATLTVSNHPPCAPSVADNWLLLCFSDFVGPQVYSYGVFSAEVIPSDVGKDYLHADNIYDKLKPRPLPAGGAETGYFFVLFRDKNQADLAGNKFQICFTDVIGNWVRAEAQMPDVGSSDKPQFYTPGMIFTRPKVTPKKPLAEGTYRARGDGTYAEVRET